MSATKAKNQEAAADDLGVAKRVLQAEADALQKLAASVDGSFEQATSAIAAMKENVERPGRLIVAGMGKSGHVARKLTATLASTGTPSHFVHPGEASHGDMGMIMKGDVVLLLSNSGKSPELSDLIHYTRRFGITLIGMTANADSALAQHSDIVLLLPKVPEACPNNLAPTTSTTMMMALGDALAIALLERLGLTAEQFKVFHPGGNIGKKLQAVRDIMHSLADLPMVDESAHMQEALLELTSKNLGAVLVVDTARALKGIITDGDLKRHMDKDLLGKSVLDVMSRNPRSISQDALAVEAVNVMTKTPNKYLTSLIVTGDADELVGMIRLQDCLQAGIT
jgi:arabinose-5-phosphate isomerase